MKTGLIIPAYIYPKEANGNGKIISPDWQAILDASQRLKNRLLVIINPASGPGEKANEDYLGICKHLKKNQSYVIGYVHLLGSR